MDYPTDLTLFRNRACRLSLMFLTMLAAPIAFAQKTSTIFDKNFDFSGHKRYSWRQNRLMTRQHPNTNKIMDLKIVTAVNQADVATVFGQVKTNPRSEL